MLEVSKVWNAWNTVQLIKDQRACWRCRWCETLYCIINKGSKAIYVVFVVFTQHCIQSNVTHLTHVRGVECVLCIQWPLTPARRKAIWAFCLGGLALHHQSVWGGSFVNFLGLVKLQGWLQARCTANPQFLKLRGHSATWKFSHIYGNKAASSIP